MKASEILFDQNISNRDKFGSFVKCRMEELNMRAIDLAIALHISPAYVADIVKGNRHAPLNHLDDLVQILKVETDDLYYFYDIAGCSHGNWPDINEYLAQNPNARKAIRLAKAKNLSEEEFLNAVNQMIQSQAEEEPEEFGL